MRFPNMETLQHFWIASLSNHNPNAFFCVEARNRDGLIIDNKFNISPKSIATIHNCHLIEDHNRIIETQKSLTDLLHRIDDYDAVICLTHKQKQDIIDEFGPHDNLYVIRHPSQVSLPKEGSITDTQRSGLVMICHLRPQKQIDHAIRAMSIVHSIDPDIKLTIYGKGKEYKKLHALIAQLHLEDTVILAGYTSNPTEKLRQAAASIITSKYEGLCLSILESLSNGTPCIAYDMNYGPRELIVDGENGRLVEPNNIEELARVIVETLHDRAKLMHMCQNAPKSIPQDFSEKYIARQWEELLETIDSQQNQHCKDIVVTAPAAELSQSRIEYDGTDTLRINLQFEAGIPQANAPTHEPPRFFLRITNRLDQLHTGCAYLATEGRIDDNGTVVFDFTLPTESMKKLLEINPDMSFGMHEYSHYAERPLQQSVISAIVLKAVPYCNERTTDCLKELVRYSHPDLHKLRHSLPSTEDFSLMNQETIDAALRSTSIRVTSGNISPKHISFKGTLSSKLLPDINHLEGVIRIESKDDNTLIAATAPVIIEHDPNSTNANWHSSMHFQDSQITHLTPQFKKQYWRIALELSYNGQTVLRTKGFKPFATLKAGCLTIGSYRGKKVLII